MDIYTSRPKLEWYDWRRRRERWRLQHNRALFRLGADTARYEASTACQEIGEPKRVVCWAFYLFVLAIAFDSVSLTGEDFALTKLAGILFLAVALLADRRTCFRKPPQALFWFAGYICVYTALAMFQSATYRDQAYTRMLTLVQVACLFWVAYNLMRFPRVAEVAWIAFVIGCVSVSVLQVTHIGGTVVDADRQIGATRNTTLGANANQLCGVLSLAVVALVGPFFSRSGSKIKAYGLFVPALVLLLAGILATVSRGGILALVAGLALFLFNNGSQIARFRNRVFAVALLGAVLFAIFSTGYVRTRFESVFSKGSLAKREYLYPAEMEMFWERPLAGWGPVAHRYELGRRVYWVYPHLMPDTHNLFLWIATESGLLGLVPYIGFAILCLRGAWIARSHSQGIQPLAMMATLIIVNTSGTWIYSKLAYLVLAYALASAAPLRSPQEQAEVRNRNTVTHWPRRKGSQ